MVIDLDRLDLDSVNYHIDVPSKFSIDSSNHDYVTLYLIKRNGLINCQIYHTLLGELFYCAYDDEDSINYFRVQNELFDAVRLIV